MTHEPVPVLDSEDLICNACSRPFLRYTEYGGHYQDDRIRKLDAGLIDHSAAD